MAVSYLPSNTCIGDYYLIDKPISIGGISTVYLATHTVIPQHKFAIRLLHPEYSTSSAAVERFREGMLALLRINHADVLRPYDLVQKEKLIGVAMEFVDGVPLSQMIQSGSVLSLQEKRLLLLTICETVSIIHSSGVAHCNITPAHIMLKSPTDLKLIDFSSARLASGKQDQIHSNILIRRSRYVSPEQTAGYTGSVLSDIYAVGAIAFELFLGKPFDGNLQLYGDQKSLLPPGISEILHRALASAPASRYRSMSKFYQDFKSLRLGGDVFIASGFSAQASPKVAQQPFDNNPRIVLHETCVLSPEAARKIRKRLNRFNLSKLLEQSESELARLKSRFRRKRKLRNERLRPPSDFFMVKASCILAVIFLGTLICIGTILRQPGAYSDQLASTESRSIPAKLSKQAPAGNSDSEKMPNARQSKDRKVKVAVSSAKPFRTKHIASEIAAALMERAQRKSQSESTSRSGNARSVSLFPAVHLAGSSSSDDVILQLGKKRHVLPERQKEALPEKVEESASRITHTADDSMQETVEVLAMTQPGNNYTLMTDEIFAKRLQEDFKKAVLQNKDSRASHSKDMAKLLAAAKKRHSPLVTKILIQYSTSSIYSIRIAALKSLNSSFHLLQDDGRQAIEASLSDNDYLVRGYAAKILASLKTPSSKERLKAHLETENHPVVRQVIEDSIKRNLKELPVL